MSTIPIGSMLTKPQSIVPVLPPPPPRERLELMLSNGPDLIDVVQNIIDKYKLPYCIRISDSNWLWNDKPTKITYGYLFDTLSPGELHLAKFITDEYTTIKMKDMARKMAKTPYEVLIIGETGTGKEIIAKSMIADRKGSVKAVNCAGFPETLLESELFGYAKGSFTGADTTRDGLLAKLLRAIQEKRIRKVGGNKDEDINCKFVFATNRDLKDMVDKGLFRRDLYARISTLELFIKPLRPERLCDIVPITRSLVGGDKFLEKYGSTLESFDLSLNVRSLQQYVIRYSVLGSI